MRSLMLCLFATCATAAPIYRYCDPAVEDCTVIHTVRHPTADEQMGLSNMLFATWFHLPGESFWWSITDSSADGVIIGQVQGIGSASDYNTEFVFKAGVLYCCWTDFPFRLYDINDAGFIVGGWDPPDAGLEVFCTPGHLRCEGDGYRITMAPGQEQFAPNALYIIDDRNWILSDLGTLVPTGIPEPSTNLSIGTALLILAVYRLRRPHPSITLRARENCREMQRA